jgi:DnaK suppressor protein
MAKVKESKPTTGKNGFKCPFSAEELGKWRQILIAKRVEISGDIKDLVKDAMEAEDGHTTPNHIAERGSDADLQDLSLGVAGDEKELLWQIDRAIRKIDENKPIPFGLCEFTKQPIPRNRLQLIPWTPLSMEGAAQMERDNLPLEDMLEDD